MFNFHSKKLLNPLLSRRPFSSIPALKDTFGRKHNYLRISLTEKCNFRCTYCMPEEGVKLSDSQMTNSDISRLVNLFVKQCGVTKVRLTGGEPTVRKDLDQIIADIRQHDQIQSIGMTTNGALLSRRLQNYADAGLDTINISLDSLVPAKNEMITRRFNTTKRAI